MNFFDKLCNWFRQLWYYDRPQVQVWVTDKDRSFLPTNLRWPDSVTDVFAAIHTTAVIQPGGRITVPCGFGIKMPLGYDAMLISRPSMARKYGVTVMDSPHLLGNEFQGEVFVILVNQGNRPYAIHRGERIAKLAFRKVPEMLMVELAKEPGRIYTVTKFVGPVSK